jgi:hypothetical protein
MIVKGEFQNPSYLVKLRNCFKSFFVIVEQSLPCLVQVIQQFLTGNHLVGNLELLKTLSDANFRIGRSYRLLDNLAG